MIIKIAFKYLSPIFILGQKLIKTFPFHKDLREPEKQDRPCPRQRTGTAPAGENTSPTLFSRRGKYNKDEDENQIKGRLLN